MSNWEQNQESLQKTQEVLKKAGVFACQESLIKDLVEMLQAAKEEGYKKGYHEGYGSAMSTTN